MHVPGVYAFAKAHVDIKKTIAKRRQTGSNEQIVGKFGKQSSELGQEAIMETTIRMNIFHSQMSLFDSFHSSLCTRSGECELGN